MMITENKPVVIEIPEEAYKQNSIYRPWPDIKAGRRQESAIRTILSHDSRQVVEQNHG